MKIIWNLLTLLFITTTVSAQTNPMSNDEPDIIEISGVVVVNDESSRKTPIPFATVAVKNTARGTYANFQGIFSIVVEKGETLVFSGVGYETVEVTIEKTMQGIQETVVIELAPADINIEEVLVFPWPDRDNLTAEFLAMSPNEALQLQDLAEDNLNERRMLAIANATAMDGSENAGYYLQMQAKNFAYQGQQRPMPILDPLAWSRFFKQQKENKEKRPSEDEGF